MSAEFETKATQFASKVQQATTPAQREECFTQLRELKLTLASLSHVNAVTREYTAQQKKEIAVARDVLEYATLLSVKAEDVESFDRNLAQVKAYYADYCADSPMSSSQPIILALNLMRLLANNDIGALHAELELLPEAVRSTVHVKYAMELERLMLEGNYHRVRVVAANAPDPSFQFFVRLLVPTMRREVASCVTAAYDSIGKQTLQQMLLFDAVAEFDAFVKDRKNWLVVGDRVHFEREQTAVKDVTRVASQLIEQNVTYARQVERIV